MKLKDAIFFFGAAILAIVAIAITFSSFQAFSGFAAGLAKAVLCIIFFYAFDKIVLSEVDTLDEIINQKNTAYAIFIFSFALIFAATIATA